MQQRAAARGADETICFGCGATVKRDVGQCPNCGSRIAAGPQQTPGQFIQPQLTERAVAADMVGAGRYVLNFVLAGIVGLALTYFLRSEGWLATWISAVISVLLIAFVVATR